MAWHKNAISDGEIDALHKAALAACNDDTRSPLWRGSAHHGNGECLNMARWLATRLGGHVGANRGHYVWLSPDEHYAIDLTGAHSGAWSYTTNDGYHRVDVDDNVRSTRYAKRADRIFASLDQLIRLSLDYAGDAYPAEEPQAADDSERFNDSFTEPEQYWHDESDPQTPEGVYQFIYAQGQLEVSPNHGHNELADHVGIDPSQHTGPFAAGHVAVTNGRATWQVQANINLHAFFKILKDATKNYGWTWGGMTDANGQPIIEQFAPKKSSTTLHYVIIDGHLYLGAVPTALLALSGKATRGRLVTGTVRVSGNRATMASHTGGIADLGPLFDWASDSSLTLYAGLFDRFRKPVRRYQDAIQGFDWGTWNPDVCQASGCEQPTTWHWRHPGTWYDKYLCDQHHAEDIDIRERGAPRPEEWEYTTSPYQSDGVGERPIEWKYGNNDNTIKTIPDLQEGNNYNPQTLESPNPAEPPPVDERLPSGLYSCPGCDRLFPNWHEYSKHRFQGCDVDTDHPDANGDGGLPEPDHDLYGDGAHYTEMRQEPGITTGKVVVLPARTWKEAARVDGFMKYATAFKYDNDSHLFYVAYRNGDPLGYAAIKPDGEITMMQSSVENQGVAHTIFRHLTKHFPEMSTHAAHEKTAGILKRAGWVQAKGQLWRWAKDKAPTDLLDGPVPFIYDVDTDKVYVGHPGARTSDIPGRFTPGGIVEGMYEPGGKVVIRSLTSVPYTVRHLIELWYYTHPQLEVKSVHLKDDAGKDTRLASHHVSSTVRLAAGMDPASHLASNVLMQAGGDVWAVGGAVRDVLLDKEPHDIDLMVTGLSQEKVAHLLQSLPGYVVREGRDFPVFHYRHKGHEAQVALPRRERSTGPRHEDFDVESDHTMKPEDDFERRDFTANAMGVNLRNGQFLDPFGGAADITSGTLRATHDKALAEDPLRVVRGIVAHARHGLDPDEATRAQMRANAQSLEHLPAERIQAELDKLMGADNPASGIRLAHETGVLGYMLPEVEAAFGFDQNNPHHELELGAHLTNVLDRISERTQDPDLRLAALLHDIGKPGSAWVDPETGSNHYYEYVDHDERMPETRQKVAALVQAIAQGELPQDAFLPMSEFTYGAPHERLGAEMAHKRLTALKYPNDRIKRVSELVEHHMWPAFTTDRGARRFLARVGDHADDLMTLRWADQGGKSEYPTDPSLSLERQQRLIERARNAGHATTQNQLAINGHDLITAGIKPGPQMGQILRTLTAQVIDDPALNTTATLLELAHGLFIPPQDLEGRHQASSQEDEPGAVRQGEPRKLAQGDAQAEVDPEFPSVGDAQEIHDQAVADHGRPYAPLLDQGKLESAMGRAANHWYYGEGAPAERMADSAGALAHGIGMAQAFADGNKKTAYHTTRYFLHNNGYGHLSPFDTDDEELADNLTGHAEGTHSLQDTQQMFRSRLGAR